MSKSMPSNSKASSTVIQNNPESSCIYRRSSKRKLQTAPIHNTYAPPSNTTTEDKNKKVSFLSAEEEQGNQKLVILECEDMNTFSENFCKRPFNTQKYLPPTNERNANGNVFILQQDEHMNSRNIQRKDDNFGATEDNGAVSSSRADFSKSVKDLQLGDTPLLSDPIMNEGQSHASSVSSGLQLPMTTFVAAKPLSMRDRTEETQKAIAKSDSTMDGGRTPAPYSAIRIIPKSDEFDSIGQNIAAKLRRLPREQGILAEKLLNDVMYEAAMGMLNRGSKLLSPSPYGANWGNMPPFSSSLSTPNSSLNEFNLYSRFYGFYNQ